MTPDLARRTLLAASCLGAPAFGVVAALATPALATTPSTELHEIAASPDAYYVYGLCILLSSMLLVPAVFALVELIRPHRAWGALLTCVVAQIGMLVAVGDSASELVFWQMGARRADLPAMIAATDGFDSAPGASLIYTIGGLCTLVGVLALGILLWRTGALAWWAAAALPVGAIANVAGFSVASRPTLTASYVLIAVALVPAAAAILRQSVAPEPSPTSITSPAPLGAHD